MSGDASYGVSGWGPVLRQANYRPKTTGGPLTRFPCEVDVYLDAVAILIERNAAVHPELLAVEAMVPAIEPEPVPLPVTVKYQLLGFVTLRIVKCRRIQTVSGPVCVTFVEMKVINGFCLTSKKSFPFSLPSLKPLPVFTLSA